MQNLMPVLFLVLIVSVIAFQLLRSFRNLGLPSWLVVVVFVLIALAFLSIPFGNVPLTEVFAAPAQP